MFQPDFDLAVFMQSNSRNCINRVLQCSPAFFCARMYLTSSILRNVFTRLAALILRVWRGPLWLSRVIRRVRRAYATQSHGPLYLMIGKRRPQPLSSSCRFRVCFFLRQCAMIQVIWGKVKHVACQCRVSDYSHTSSETSCKRETAMH